MSARRDPALDGVRAVAVVAVMAYHGGLPWSGGGFLGVDVFFVLSGYLITTGLLAGGGLGSFWLRRARRLLPALVVIVLAVAIYAATAAPADTVVGLRGDALATLAYVANWRFIAAGRSYFAHAAPPSLLQHTWSLAIEEQFYVVWPLVVLAFSRRRSWLLPFAAMATLGSAVLMAALYHPGLDPSRVYFGTDTHAQSVLAGCVLALVIARVGGLRPARALGWAAWAGGAFVVAAFGRFGAGSTLLYRGGFLAVAVATAALVAGLVSGSAPRLAALLGHRAAARLGLISYGVYLWHWPVFLVVDGAATGLTGWPLFAVRAAITLALAEVSFRVVEAPFLRGRPGRRRVIAVPVCAAGALAALVVTSGSVVTAGAAPAVGPSAAARATLLLVGDSVAATLGLGLSLAAPASGVRVVDRATLGCGVLQGGPIRDQGEVVQPPPMCAAVPAQWGSEVTSLRPDVAALLVGRWEVMDRKIGGRWEHIGQPAFDAAVRSGLAAAVHVLGSGGARVALLTAPYYQGREQPDGARWPQDDRRRVDAFNAIVRQVAASTGATVVDLGGALCPSGRYQATVGATTVRWSDGIHVTLAGGALVAPAVWGALHLG